MKFVIQRVSYASVTVDNEVIGKINKGLLVLVGISKTDTNEIANKMVDKLIKMRIFEDAEGKTNLSLGDVNGELLIISQFTLYANCKKGNRPSFIEAGSPSEANRLYEYILDRCKERCPIVGRGLFGADMKVELLNDGPFKIAIDSEEIM